MDESKLPSLSGFIIPRSIVWEQVGNIWNEETIAMSKFQKQERFQGSLFSLMTLIF